MTVVQHLGLDRLRARMDQVLASPADEGLVEMIVVRPDHDARLTPDSVEVSPERGLHGDHWAKGQYRDRPDMQVTLINRRLLDLVAGSRDRWALAGDNLVVDLDLSRESLLPGQRLAVGSAVLEVAEQAHTGCKKFADRFGADALRFVNLDDGPGLRLRGVYARVVESGMISLADRVRKV